MNPNTLNALSVAYLGDAVLELYIREYLIKDLKIAKPNDLQRAAISFVSAPSQADFIKYAIENHLLSEKEIGMYKRGRNTKGKGSKNKKTLVHNISSGFETVIGTLYLNDEIERVEEIINLYKKYVNFDKK